MGALQYDLTGQRFGDWSVISYAGRIRWKSRCKCGAVHNVIAWNLSSGHTTRCNDCRKKAEWKHGQAGQPYRKPASAEYVAWQAMRRRCLNPKDSKYHLYGGRGIKICRRWEDFRNFFKDMGKKPKAARMSLERKKTNKNYAPSNCCWATQREQCSNKRNNRFVMWEKEKITATEAGRRIGLSSGHLFTMLKRFGWPKLDVSKMPQKNPSKWLRQQL